MQIDEKAMRSLPIDIVDAAQLLTDYFANHNIKSWKLHGVQNRVDDAHLQAADGWIKVSDKLPEIEIYGGVRVLVCTESGKIEECSYWWPNKGRPHFTHSESHAWDRVEVTHWQPLPNPPKDKE